MVLLQLRASPAAEAAAAHAPDPTLADYFVAIQPDENGSKQFVLGCNQFPISGFNECVGSGGARPMLAPVPPVYSMQQPWLPPIRRGLVPRHLWRADAARPACRWEVMEAGAGAPFLTGSQLPSPETGPEASAAPRGPGGPSTGFFSSSALRMC